MTYQDFLTRVIDEGIEEVKKTEREPHKRDGAIEGFEACRGKLPYAIMNELTKSREASRTSMTTSMEDDGGDDDLIDYWKLRYKELQIEWVLNVMSAAFQSNGIAPLVTPTARGYMMAARILGVSEPEHQPSV